MAGESILIVDDNPANLRLLAFLLEKRAYVVRTAADATEARTKLQQQPAHLLLLDLQLPGIGGLALAAELRRDPAYQRLIIVAVTAFAMKGDLEQALEAGCDSYITKPIDTRGLPLLVADLLARGRASPEAAISRPKGPVTS